MYSIGIDIGASHMGCGLVKDNEKLEIRNYLLIQKMKAEELISILLKQIEDLIKVCPEKVSKIGLACPGDCVPATGLVYKPLDLLDNDINFIEELKPHLPNIPIYIENDGNCALMGEYLYGALKRTKKAVCVALGTNVGCGILYKKENIKLGNSQAQYRTIFADMPNTPSLRILTEQYALACQVPINSISRAKIFEDIEKGDYLATKTLQQYIEKLSIGLKKMSELTNSRTICIGGGLSEFSHYFLLDLQEKLPDLTLHTANLQNDAAIIGAANLPYGKEKIALEEVQN